MYFTVSVHYGPSPAISGLGLKEQKQKETFRQCFSETSCKARIFKNKKCFECLDAHFKKGLKHCFIIRF